MGKRRYLYFVLCVLLISLPAAAQNRFILRPAAGTSANTIAQRYSLDVVEPLDSAGSVYLVTAPSSLTVQEVETEVGSDNEVTDIEPDQDVGVPELNQSTAAILDNLPSPTPVNYFGSQVLAFYLSQPAVSLVNLPNAQQTYEATGEGIVAIIDTGVDPYHPVLQGSLVPGYDFVNNIAGSASEWVDLTQNNASALSQSSTDPSTKNVVAMVNQSTAAILDQSTAAILDANNLPPAFGHGTMVAGVVHLAAPTARIMPLKAFKGDGTANLSDILRAIYYAADHDANVINMSFSLTSPSDELADAIEYADQHDVICVASAGNTGTESVGTPASLPYVMGVASISNLGVRSTFSSYGTGVFLAAPGEGIVTTYPGNNYAEATGTSFSAPFVTGTAALGVQMDAEDYTHSSQALSHATPLSGGLGNGGLDAYQTVGSLAGED